MTDYTTKDAVEFAMDDNASEFRSAVSDLLMKKVEDAVSLKKLEVASSFMSAETEQEVEIEGEPDVDQEV
jgi:hypothetical protein